MLEIITMTVRINTQILGATLGILIQFSELMNIEATLLHLESQWMNLDFGLTHNLIHISTTGAAYTWNNGRGAHRHTERRLDRSICTPNWIDSCTSVNCSTLIRHRSYHHPILLEFHMSDHKFSSRFKFMKMWSFDAVQKRRVSKR